MNQITFIGLGKMGSALVRRLIESGYRVTVYNRSILKSEQLAKEGAVVANSIKEAVENAKIIFSCLLNDEALSRVSEQLINHIPKESIHVSLATVLPSTAIKMKYLHEKSGCHYVSCVVLGVPSVALAGELTTYCSGAKQQIEQVTPILTEFSKKVINLGEEVQSSNVMKVCLNTTLVTTIELISELYAFAEKSGLETSYIQDALHDVYAHPGFKRYIDKIHDRDFDQVNFDMIGGHKDVTLFQQAFADAGVVPALANIAKSRFISALARKQDNKDWSGIYEIIREESGLT